MEGSVLSFLKAEWKVSDTGSAHWASSFNLSSLNDFLTLTVVIFQNIEFYLYIIYMAIYVQLYNGFNVQCVGILITMVAI
jgi:hypothetical protein